MSGGVCNGYATLGRRHFVEFAFEKLRSARRTGAQGDFQELVGATCLHVLLVEKVEQKVFVALNEALRVDLTVLQLLIAVTLDAFQKRAQSLLLLLAEQSLLLFNHLFDLVLCAIAVLIFNAVAL